MAASPVSAIGLARTAADWMTASRERHAFGHLLR